MICPNCNVYDVDPESKAGWCAKCTGLFAHKSGRTPRQLLELIKLQAAYLFQCEQAVLFAQKQADAFVDTPEHATAQWLLTMAIENRDEAQGELSRIKGFPDEGHSAG